MLPLHTESTESFRNLVHGLHARRHAHVFLSLRMTATTLEMSTTLVQNSFLIMSPKINVDLGSTVRTESAPDPIYVIHCKHDSNND